MHLPPLAPSIEVRRSVAAPPLDPTTAADVVVPCDQADLAAAGGDPSRLRLARYVGGDRLLLVPTSVETGCRLRGYADDTQPLAMVALVGQPSQLDYPTADGHFFTQTSGLPGFAGYAVTDDAQAPMLSELQRLGGVVRLGYPMTARVTLDGFTAQVTERAAVQWLPERGEARLVDLMDLMSAQGYDRALNDFWLIPPVGSTADDADPAALQALNVVAAADPSYGQVTGAGRYADRVVLRTQTAVLQYWLLDTPFAHRGDVTLADVGTISVAMGMWPADATTPQVAPAPAPAN